MERSGKFVRQQCLVGHYRLNFGRIIQNKNSPTELSSAFDVIPFSDK
ncbi:hypothetical protein VCHC48B2_0723 [Vibrio cholerae HC-48B2]|nr:hypothetical protein VCHC43A1_0764 [Vibrio cholerae HC-43A1]EHI08816.1 hypothetical protein VCHC48B2_0723 [Vibrio cholerae HC-48B2]EKG91714.1 hypothetical protein VCHC81A2_0760 [Vibrio cholerae HC-81A2]EMQ07189.1 hypothetical protein VCEC0009_001029 [Vibrio cholerae O1 str. EC-0009]